MAPLAQAARLDSDGPILVYKRSRAFEAVPRDQPLDVIEAEVAMPRP